jgi:hypothetical protein
VFEAPVFEQISLHHGNTCRRVVPIPVTDESNHIVTGIEQRGNEMTADKTARTGDEYVHMCHTIPRAINLRRALSCSLFRLQNKHVFENRMHKARRSYNYTPKM